MGKMKNLIAAIQFITILPMGKPVPFNPKGMVPYFPVVGIMIGGLLSVFDLVVTHLWAGIVAALLNVLFLVVVTGAFHLDGLGDAADGILGHRSREKALDIMKDSRIGVMGLTAIICVLSLKWGGILSLDSNRSLLLLIIPAYARGSMLFGIKFLDYGRPGGGTGHPFFGYTVKPYAFLGMLVPFFLSFFLGTGFIILNLCFIILTASLIIFYKIRMGCITGDMLGTMVEVQEAMLFLMVSAGEAI